MLSILLTLGLGILALTFVLAPLFQTVRAKTADKTGADDKDTGSVIAEREQSAKSSLQEIELDYQLGNISQEDYNTLRERYIRRALVALKMRTESEQGVAQTRHDHDKELDDLIEEQLRALKEKDATDRI